jgi:hypothetical protein
MYCLVLRMILRGYVLELIIAMGEISHLVKVVVDGFYIKRNKHIW